MLVHTERHSSSRHVLNEMVHILSRSILMVLLRAQGELTRALNEPLPCVYNVSQMYFSSVQCPWLESRETLNLKNEKAMIG